jgi:hypothetical protein
MDRHELEKKTITDLREMAQEYEDLRGVTGMAKAQLMAALAEKLGIDLHEHVPTGIGRHDLKVHIREAKQARDAALSSGDRDGFLKARRRLKHYRRRLRKVISQALHEQHVHEAPSS